eukprot:scaffold14424_cov288-Ochromonas_danica.AAC.2
MEMLPPTVPVQSSSPEFQSRVPAQSSDFEIWVWPVPQEENRVERKCANTNEKKEKCMMSDIPLLDEEASKTWVYPTNYPIRRYQEEICQQALLSNTLVSLPTGLGKTLIAAVVIYNYMRWFPNGKIIFMAPTRPLVSQQCHACQDILQLSSSQVVVLEGSIPAERRVQHYQRGQGAPLVFCTPQTLLNDLKTGRLHGSAIVCLVFDEAHRAATENYAYTLIIDTLEQHRKALPASASASASASAGHYRVLALSATPGGDMRKIQRMITNLHIEHVEIRTEDDVDLLPYLHDKAVEVIPCCRPHRKQGSYSSGSGPAGGQGVVGFLREEIDYLMQSYLDALHSQGILLHNHVHLITSMVIQEVERDWKAIFMEEEEEVAGGGGGGGSSSSRRRRYSREQRELLGRIEMVKVLLEVKKVVVEEDWVAASKIVETGITEAKQQEEGEEEDSFYAKVSHRYTLCVLSGQVVTYVCYY